MEWNNLTSLEDFLIVGFSDLPQVQVPLFIAFSLMYLATLLGNLLIMAIIYFTSQLHTPMYFFLTHLSFLDISYTTVIFPNMLSHFFQQGTYVSLNECVLQLYFFMVMLATEFLLLTVMAYDRYVAICNPLRYMVVMNKAVCLRMAVGSYVLGFMAPISHTFLAARIIYCRSHAINHFFCDIAALLKLSCSSTRTIETLTYLGGVTFGLGPFVLIITSYINIISAILKIQSTKGRQKAFSTCASHLTVVILFYVSVCSTYMRPTSAHTMKDNKILSLTYIAITPLCNPIIYSLKNTEFKNALRKIKNES